jgi:hypothetical protein
MNISETTRLQVFRLVETHGYDDILQIIIQVKNKKWEAWLNEGGLEMLIPE